MSDATLERFLGKAVFPLLAAAAIWRGTGSVYVGVATLLGLWAIQSTDKP